MYVQSMIDLSALKINVDGYHDLVKYEVDFVTRDSSGDVGGSYSVAS
jgi:hypothetical protein